MIKNGVKMKKLIVVLLLVLLSGCATNQGITELAQAEVTDKTKVLILKDDATRESVLPVLEKWFVDNGYSSTVIDSLREADPDNYVISYRAWWSWDVATYMRRVEMAVNKEGETLGNLNFDALQYGGFGKFGDAEERLRILLDALFGKITREEANKLLGEA